MGISRSGSMVRVLSVSLMLTFSSTVAMPLLLTSVGSIAEASVAADKGDKDAKDKKTEEQRRSQNEDRVLNGQVLEIDTLKDPPELIVGSVDGETVIRVLKTDEIVRNGVHLGDFIQADGEKISEQLFEATELSVSSRYAGEVDDGDSKEKDKKKN